MLKLFTEGVKVLFQDHEQTLFMIRISSSQAVFCRQSFVGHESAAGSRSAVPCHRYDAAVS